MGMERLFRLSDRQWAVIEPLVRRPPTRGRRPKPDREMVEAMIWIARTGAPWRDLPSAYGPWQSVYTRFSRWSVSGKLARLFEALSRERDGEAFYIDASTVRAHQDAQGAAKKGGPASRSLAQRCVHEGPRRRRRAGKSGSSKAH